MWCGGDRVGKTSMMMRFFDETYHGMNPLHPTPFSNFIVTLDMMDAMAQQCNTVRLDLISKFDPCIIYHVSLNYKYIYHTLVFESSILTRDSFYI
jgi:GTPase SAR1 family protein